MTNLTLKKTKILVMAISLIAMTSFAFAKKSIKELTSSKISKQLEKEIPKSNNPSTPSPKGELKRHTLGIGLGQTSLFGEFKDRGEDQITADLYYTFSASHSFDMFANLHYSKHDYRSNYVTIPGLTTGIKARLFQFDAFSPYVLGGMGFYRPKMKRTVEGKIQTTEAKITFGLNAGAGADLRLDEHFSVGVIAHYHNPFDVSQDEGTDLEGSYFKLLMLGYYTF
ncbi:MAG: outer membrane beta-barrel protein [Bacteriovoracaceae bacterium]|nr:outer membrane beta-barrel protein [Bacteriovoracaceae bacterium]